MADPKTSSTSLDALEREYAAELERILGVSHVKTASAAGTPEEVKAPLTKKASTLTKLSEMSLEDIMRHPAFLQGVQAEVDACRHIWEPLVEAFVRENLGQ